MEKADDLTGNVVSKGVSWTAQKFENFCNAAENAAGNFVQRVGGSETAVNYAKDSVRVGLKVTKEAVKLTAAGGVAKGITCAAAKTASVAGKMVGKSSSVVKGTAKTKIIADNEIKKVKFPSTKGYYKDVTPDMELKTMKKKYELLKEAEKKAVNKKVLLDGKIRYYEKETMASSPGKIRGAGYVTELDPQKETVRSWYESRDHKGEVQMVHPKNINGIKVEVPHYPHITKV